VAHWTGANIPPYRAGRSILVRAGTQALDEVGARSGGSQHGNYINFCFRGSDYPNSNPLARARKATD